MELLRRRRSLPRATLPSLGYPCVVVQIRPARPRLTVEVVHNSPIGANRGLPEAGSAGCSLRPGAPVVAGRTLRGNSEL